jgi:hypothetical protein
MFPNRPQRQPVVVDATGGFAPDSLNDFMRTRIEGWTPQRPEPVLLDGDPPPRRRNRGGMRHMRHPRLLAPLPLRPPQSAPEEEPLSPDCVAPINPVISVSDAQLRAAFGPSLMYGHSAEEPNASRLAALKLLSVEEMANVFKNAPPPPSPMTHPSPNSPNSPVWPPLPPGPPPPQAFN